MSLRDRSKIGAVPRTFAVSEDTLRPRALRSVGEGTEPKSSRANSVTIEADASIGAAPEGTALLLVRAEELNLLIDLVAILPKAHLDA